MLAALDAHYDSPMLIGTAAAVVFERWEDALPAAEHAATCSNIQTYESGAFYKRELPCLLAVLEKVREPLDLIIIDGYVTLGDKPGLGMHLWDALGKKLPIIGIAKTRFHSGNGVEVLRGLSRTPLYVTAVGIDSSTAAANVRRMHGQFRIPTLLKRVDQLARKETL